MDEIAFRKRFSEKGDAFLCLPGQERVFGESGHYNHFDFGKRFFQFFPQSSSPIRGIVRSHKASRTGSSCCFKTSRAWTPSETCRTLNPCFCSTWTMICRKRGSSSTPRMDIYFCRRWEVKLVFCLAILSFLRIFVRWVPTVSTETLRSFAISLVERPLLIQ